jgi:hypothetical protein
MASAAGSSPIRQASRVPPARLVTRDELSNGDVEIELVVERRVPRTNDRLGGKIAARARPVLDDELLTKAPPDGYTLLQILRRISNKSATPPAGNPTINRTSYRSMVVGALPLK